MKLKLLVYGLSVIVALGAAAASAWLFSPWPSAYLARSSFETDLAQRNESLKALVPADVEASLDVPYGDGGDELLDVFLPAGTAASGKPVPAVVWMHGGAFIAGDRRDVADYLKVLAGRGVATVAVGYSLAPAARYPTPVVQANKALAFLAANAGKLHIDPARIVLAGDQAGAQIAAQLAAAIAEPDYAAGVGITPAIERDAVKAVVLFSGVYDVMPPGAGEYGEQIATALWAYLGDKDFGKDPRYQQFRVGRHVTGRFPPTFISAGNGDPLAPQSRRIAKAIADAGASVDELFFRESHTPPLAHQYQFQLADGSARHAFNRLNQFLARVTR